MLVRTAHKAIQVLGAHGLTTEEGFRTERYYRDAAMGGIGEGTMQILKLVIGRKLTGILAFMDLSKLGNGDMTESNRPEQIFMKNDLVCTHSKEVDRSKLS